MSEHSSSDRMPVSPHGDMRRSGQRGFLRALRLGGPVTLGVDGRPCEPDDPLSGLVGGSAEETAEAGSIVDVAVRRADELVAAAFGESASIRDRAYQDGHASGYEAGARVARAELADALALVQRVASEAAAVRNHLIRQSEPEMVEMVIAAVHAILGTRASEDRDLAVRTVRRALARAGAQNVVRVRVNAADAMSVSAAMAEAEGAAPPFEVLADGSVGIGGCIVETAHGRVDARLDVQLEAVAELLRSALPAETGALLGDAGANEEAADAA